MTKPDDTAPAPHLVADDKPIDQTATHPEWIWYCESTSGVPVISFGRWPKHPQQRRYKYAEIQATEHDHPAPQPRKMEALDAHAQCLLAAQNNVIDGLMAENEKLRRALEPFALFFKSELHDLSPASDATVFAAFQHQTTGAPLADLSIADVRRAYAALAATEGKNDE